MLRQDNPSPPSHLILSYPDDAELAIRMAARDHTAFEQIYDRHCGQAFGLCIYILGDNRVSETVLQESFWQVWQTAGNFDPTQTRFTHWLLSIVHHCAIEELRRLRGLGRPLIEMNMGGSETHPIHDVHSNVVDAMLANMHNMHNGQMKASLEQLPAMQFSIIMQAFYGGYSLHEIALHLDEPLDTVHTCAQSGLATLRNLLAD